MNSENSIIRLKYVYKTQFYIHLYHAYYTDHELNISDYLKVKVNDEYYELEPFEDEIENPNFSHVCFKHNCDRVNGTFRTAIEVNQIFTNKLRTYFRRHRNLRNIDTMTNYYKANLDTYEFIYEAILNILTEKSV